MSIIPSSIGLDLKEPYLTSVSGNTLYVGGTGPGNYSKIQDAIDNASSGDTVFVFSGIYYERIKINKTIDLIGEDKNSTIIDGSGITKVVNISTTQAIMSGFTIQNGSQYTLYIDSYSSHNTITGNIIINRYDHPTSHIGIWLNSGSTNNIVSDNDVEMFFSSGITVNGHYNIISGNRVKDNRWYGIFISEGFNNICGNNIYKIDDVGINLWSDNNIISENTIMDNCNDGIYIQGDLNTVSGNSISNNTNGIRIKYYSEENNIFENLITNNTYGVHATSSSNNQIYHNNLLQNAVNAFNTGNNNWDAGYPLCGNYWDDYNGTDANDDGIGDISYNISGGNSRDRYPFMDYDGWFEFGAWWDDNWKYKKRLHITNATADYQMAIQVWKEDGHDNASTGEIDCEDHCKPDFSDIRFVDANQSALLSYWIEEAGTTDDDHYARIWVKTSGSRLIYMYYGNPNAIDASNGTDTFQYFDHWVTDNTGEWVYGVPTTDHHHWWEDTKSFTTCRTLYLDSMLKSWNAGTQDWTVLGWSQDNSSDWRDVDHAVVQWRMNESSGATDEIVPVRLHVRYGSTNGTTVTKEVAKPDPNHKLSLRLQYYSDNVTYQWKDLDNDTILASGSITDPLVIPPPSNLQYLLHGELDLGEGTWSYLSPTYLKWGNKPVHGGCEWHTDYWYIRNYTCPEPLWGSFGSEQELITIVYVDDDFNTSTSGWGYDHFDNIKDGIDGVVEGGTVFIHNGIYYENVVVDKRIDLKGEDNEKTIIDGMQKEDVVFVDKVQFNICSLTIRNGNKKFSSTHGIEIRHTINKSTINDCIIFDSFYGIGIEDASNIRILDCNIFDNLEGIMLINASYCEVNNCRLSNRQGGVSINMDSEYNNVIDCSITGNMTGGGCGIDIYDNNNNVIGCNISNGGDGLHIGFNGGNNKIENCNISDNYGRGIVIGEGHNNHIKNTIISNNGLSGDEDESLGVEIFEGSNNVIECCQILNNGDGGIWIGWNAWNNYIIKSTIENNGHSSSYFGEGILCHQGNYIYLNNFIDNRVQAYDVESKSHWDNGELGNYWSDYNGKDNNYDGIGDTPYNLYDESNQDNYPLMLPYKDEPSVKITIPQDGFLYCRNLKLFPFRTTLIIGNIKIKASAANYQNEDVEIEKVEFYVDGRLRWIDRRAPYTWRWRLSSHIKHNHIISVVAYDTDGNTAVDERQVCRFF